MAEDPLDPDTGILRNLVGATTQQQLDRAEADLVSNRMLDLLDKPVPPTRDLAELQAIHQQLFQDVYPWAGQLRTVNIRKSGGDAEPFLPHQLIPEAGATATRRLGDDHHLEGITNRDHFVERLAYHYEAFNFTHPFREGNGRTQRFMWDSVAAHAGHQLDWRNTTRAENDQACRAASDRGDLRPLVNMFHHVVTTPDQNNKEEATEAARIAHLAFGISASAPTRATSSTPTTHREGRDTLSLRDRGLQR